MRGDGGEGRREKTREERASREHAGKSIRAGVGGSPQPLVRGNTRGLNEHERERGGPPIQTLIPALGTNPQAHSHAKSY